MTHLRSLLSENAIRAAIWISLTLPSLSNAAEVRQWTFRPPEGGEKVQSEAWKQFVGDWRVGRPTGPDFMIVLQKDFVARCSLGVTGRWEYVNGEARIQWSTGNWNVIRPEGSGYRKLYFKSGMPFDGPPADSGAAEKISAEPQIRPEPLAAGKSDAMPRDATSPGTPSPPPLLGDAAARLDSDQAAIEGEWQVTSVRRAGGNLAAPLRDRYVFAGGMLAIHVANNPPSQMKYTLDSTRVPKQLDVVLESHGQPQVSAMIYELQGDTLRICYPAPGDPRPKVLDTKPGDRFTSITMIRKPASNVTTADDSSSRAITAGTGSLLTQAIAHYDGTAGRVDTAKAHELFLKASQAGDPLATMWVARCYNKARCGFPKDETKAQELARSAIQDVERLAHQGQPAAMALWASALEEGLGTAQKSDEATHWYTKAAEAGNVFAMGKAGWILKNGGAPAQAVPWFRKAADAGSTTGMSGLGSCYEFGEGLAGDTHAAYLWYLKGAEAGDVASMFYTGNMYLNGSGVERDPRKAAEWFRRGAELGDADCMTNLGECYNRGIGVDANPAEVVRWVRKAAELGSDTGMFNLAVMNFWGIGVPEDRVEAVRWMRAAAAAGHQEATVALRELEASAEQTNTAFEPTETIGGNAAVERVREQTERFMRKYRQQLVEKLPYVARPWDPHQNWPPPATLPR